MISIWTPGFSQASELKPFETDYCTMFFEGTWQRPNVWKPCCFEHDLRYWFGGKKSEMHKADLELKQCVRQRAGSFWANLMYYAIRTGHFSPIKNKYKWGWGWSTARHFQELSNEDKLYIREKLTELKLPSELLDRFLTTYNL